MFKRSVLTLTACGLLAGTTGVAVATADSGGDTSAAALGAQTAAIAATTLPAGSPLAAPVASVEPTTAKAFKVFRDKAATRMPADLAAGIASPEKFGRNANLARAITTPRGQGWLIPGRGYVCLAVPNGDAMVTSCKPASIAADEGIQIGVGGKSLGDDVQVTTVAPDGADVVEVSADGTTKDVATNADDVSNATVPADATIEVAP